MDAEIENRKDRVKIYKVQKELLEMLNEFMKKQENQFFEEMKLDIEIENKINELTNNNLKSNLVREFIVEIKTVGVAHAEISAGTFMDLGYKCFIQTQQTKDFNQDLFVFRDIAMESLYVRYLLF